MAILTLPKEGDVVVQAIESRLERAVCMPCACRVPACARMCSWLARGAGQEGSRRLPGHQSRGQAQAALTLTLTLPLPLPLPLTLTLALALALALTLALTLTLTRPSSRPRVSRPSRSPDSSPTARPPPARFPHTTPHTSHLVGLPFSNPYPHSVTATTPPLLPHLRPTGPLSAAPDEGRSALAAPHYPLYMHRLRCPQAVSSRRCALLTRRAST
eukprot:scaffold14551_cov61-Phaeocystis_antarctica.AAC.8